MDGFLRRVEVRERAVMNRLPRQSRCRECGESPEVPICYLILERRRRRRKARRSDLFYFFFWPNSKASGGGGRRWLAASREIGLADQHGHDMQCWAIKDKNIEKKTYSKIQPKKSQISPEFDFVPRTPTRQLPKSPSPQHKRNRLVLWQSCRVGRVFSGSLHRGARVLGG